MTAAQVTTLVGVIVGVVSTFWTFSYIRIGRQLVSYGMGQISNLDNLQKKDVLNALFRGTQINMFGMGFTILGLASLVGTIVAKTLMSSSTTPWTQPGSNPVIALDVFVVQAASNTILCHFVSMAFNTWLTNMISNRF